MKSKWTHWVIPGSGKPFLSVLQTVEQQQAFERIIQRIEERNKKLYGISE